MAAPYPPDTRAKGWRFELDHERIRQSDTWALASPELRPWLLMIWMVAWEQTPCGSLPDDDELIAARLGMSLDTFAQAKRILLRGWRAADDGRLYHPVMTERVLEMIARRRKDADRVGRHRAAKRVDHGGVTRDTAVTHVDDARNPSQTNACATAPEPVPVPEEKKHPPTPRKRGRASPSLGVEFLASAGVEEQAARDWLAVRSRKRAPLTESAWSGVVREAASAGITPAQAVKIAAEKGWQGFEAGWIADRRGNGAATPPTASKSNGFYDVPTRSTADILRACGMEGAQ